VPKGVVVEVVVYLGSGIVRFNIKDLGLKYYTKVVGLLGSSNTIYLKGHLYKLYSRLL
jgi:hypothetical protein